MIASAGDENNKQSEPATIRILVDADACPVREEVYKVAYRYGADGELSG